MLCGRKYTTCSRILLGFLTLVILEGPALRGQEAAREPSLAHSGLALAPKDAAFFSTSLNPRKSWQEFLSSRFMTELQKLEYIQKVREFSQEQATAPTGQGAIIKRVLDDPNVKNLFKLAQDMFTDEVFVYGGREWCAFGDGFNELQNELMKAISDGEEAAQKYILSLNKDKLARIPVPTLIVGFNLTGDEIARLQLDALEGILRIAGGANQQLKPLLAGLKRADLNNGQILSFSVGTDSIPWESIPLDRMNEEQRKLFDHVISLLEKRHVTLSVGVVDKRLMLAIGESADILKKLGEGEKLISHPRLQQLASSPPKDLRSVAYVSADWRDAGYRMNFDQYFNRLVTRFEAEIKKSLGDGDETKQWLEEIVKDANWLDAKIKELVGRFDAQLSYSFAIADGMEGNVYDWSKNQLLVNANPLTVIRHAGKNSLLMFAVKQRWPKQLGEVWERIIERVPVHVGRLVDSGALEQDEAKKVDEALDKVWPLVREAYGILKDKIWPSLGEHESLLSIAAQWTTTSLGDNFPESDHPLPLPEVGGAFLLKNKDLFISGCDDMLQLLDKVLDKVREIDPDSVPSGIRIPRPEEEELAGATRYFYDVPEEALPVKGLQLQLVVGTDAVIYGLSTRQVRDMYEAKPLSTRPAWLTSDASAAAVAYVDFAGICAAIRPWIQYGLSSVAGDLEEPIQIPGDFPAPTGNDVLRIWDCFQSLGRTTGTTQINDDGSSFSRWVWVGK